MHSSSLPVRGLIHAHATRRKNSFIPLSWRVLDGAGLTGTSEDARKENAVSSTAFSCSMLLRLAAVSVPRDRP